MMNSGMWLWSVCAGLAVAVMVSYPAAGAATKDTAWIQGAGGSWDGLGNWDNGVPDATAAAIFDLGASSDYGVFLAGSAQAGELRARSGAVFFDLNGQTLAVGDVLFVGYGVGDDAEVAFGNGSLTSVWADVGHHAGTGPAPGAMTLNGTGVSWVNDMGIAVGRGTTGQLDVLLGADVTISGGAGVGDTFSGEGDPADGTLNVSGLGSTFTTQRLVIGSAGNGGASSKGTVNVYDQATLDSTGSQIQVGMGGTGELVVSGGAVITSVKGTSPSSTSGLIGFARPDYYGVGTVLLTDPDTRWTQDGSLSVGFSGDGTLTVQGGAAADSVLGHVGRRAGSVGIATVTGADSAWEVTEELYVGGEAGPDRGGAGQGGSGQLEVRDNATVSVGQRLELWDEGTVDVTGGGRLLVGSGSMPATTDQLHVGAGGWLGGTGEVLGDVVNVAGDVAPGHSTGTLALINNYTQLADGSLQIEIAGAPESGLIDVLAVTGTATLGGELVLDFGAYLPPDGSVYTFLTADRFAEAFGELSVVGLASTRVSYDMISGQFDILPAVQVMGDADGDGLVDDDDLSLLLASWSQNVGWGNGNFNGDDVVNDDDLSLLLANWTGSPSAAVPEPATIMLLATAAVAALRRRKRQRAHAPA